MSRNGESAAAVLGCLFVVALIVIMFTYFTLTGGFVLAALWAWFVTPIFGIAAPSILACSGLLVFVGFLTGSIQKSVTSSSKKSDEDAAWQLLAITRNHSSTVDYTTCWMDYYPVYVI